MASLFARTSRTRWIDRLGLIAAITCGVHCAALTGTILMVPALWLNRGLRESGLWTMLWWLEWGLLAATWVFALTAAGFSFWQRRHWLSPTLAATGLMLLTVSIATPLHGSSLKVSLLAAVSGLLVGISHWLNLRAIGRPG